MTQRSLAARLYGGALIGLLALATALAGLGTFLGPGSGDREKRRFADLPALPHSAEQWQQFPQKFESFVSDNFGFRAALISMDSAFSAVLLGRLPSDRVIIGANDWLFYAGEKSIPLYQNALPLRQGDIERWGEHLRGAQALAAAQGIGYVFVVAPDKHTIYSEHMPSRFMRKDRPSQYSQVEEVARKEGVGFIDLRQTLTAAKARGQIYYRDDTHWNDLGAALAYGRIMETLPPALGMKATVHGDGDFAPRPHGPGDLAKMALLERKETAPMIREGILPCPITATKPTSSGGDRPKLVRTTCAQGTHKLLLFRDSFSEALLPYLASTFREVVAIWEEPTLEQMKAEIAAEKPDFVLEERVERYLAHVP